MSFKQLLCRFFTQGTCNFGERCIYSHNTNEAVKIPEDVCLFFLRSNCMYGQSCRMKHQTINEIINLNDKHDEKQDEPSEKLNLEDKLIQHNTSNNLSVPDEIKSNEVTSKSYALVASTSVPEKDQNRASIPLCSFYQSNGFCVYPNCSNIHGDYCDLCGFYSVHPFNKELSDLHRAQCVKDHEESMEISFAYQKSKELSCGICLDVVLEKEPRKSRRFGILTNCSHVYCIDCIRTWRSSNMNKKNKRNCPQCRIKSDYIIPSEYFYGDKEEKEKLIKKYKQALGSKHCKYFKRGAGICPFEGACFYKHEYLDGTTAHLPMPSKLRRQQQDFASFLFLNDFGFTLSDSQIDEFDEFEDLDFGDFSDEDF